LKIFIYGGSTSNYPFKQFNIVGGTFS